MRPGELGPGRKSRERGSTFAKPRSRLRRTTELRREGRNNARTPTRKRRRRAISPASPAQRAKVRGALSIVSGKAGCDPTHVVPRSLGGCDHPLCVVPLRRREHRAYDEHRLDLLPHLIRHGCVAEIEHAIAHLGGSRSRFLRLVSGSPHLREKAP